MDRLVLKHTNLKQSCSNSRTVTETAASRPPGIKSHCSKDCVFSRLQAAMQPDARLICSRGGRDIEGDWCLTGGGRLVPG
jgi:hypothetical protein